MNDISETLLFLPRTSTEFHTDWPHKHVVYAGFSYKSYSVDPYTLPTDIYNFHEKIDSIYVINPEDGDINSRMKRAVCFCNKMKLGCKNTAVFIHVIDFSAARSVNYIRTFAKIWPYCSQSAIDNNAIVEREYFEKYYKGTRQLVNGILEVLSNDEL